MQWLDSGAIDAARGEEALHIAGILPTTAEWRQFLDRLLLFSGVVALAVAVIFFFAYNWEGMGRFGKFGLVEGLLVASLAAYWKLGAERLAGKAMLLLATLLLGALLALFGQTYQTGADPWQLFATWALLMLPWVAIGRFPPLLLIWLALLNVALYLYFLVFHGLFGVLFSDEGLLFLCFGLNGLAWGAWELAARRVPWLRARWALRLPALAAGSFVTVLFLQGVFDWRNASGAVFVVYPLWLLAVGWVYRCFVPDLFMLAGGCLSAIVAATAVLSRGLLDGPHPAGGFLLIAVAVVAMSAAAACWLRRVHEAFEP